MGVRATYLNCSISAASAVRHKTIRKADNELANLDPSKPLNYERQRQRGGGRKKIGDDSQTVIKLEAFINSHKAASPTDPDIFWVHLKPKEISLLFEKEHGLKVSHGLVKRQLLAMNFKYRKLSKNLATGKYNDRDKQFKVIFGLVAIMSLQTPVISIDCKKKEVLGNLYRTGKCYATDVVKVYDHDYSYLSEGKVIPHGIYDLQRKGD